MYGQNGRQIYQEMDRQTDSYTDMLTDQTGRSVDRYTGSQTVSQRNRQANQDRQADRQTDRQTDGQTERQTDRRTERQRDRKTEKPIRLKLVNLTFTTGNSKKFLQSIPQYSYTSQNKQQALNKKMYIYKKKAVMKTNNEQKAKQCKAHRHTR